MRILLCNERLTFRFGVDRVLILLGQKFKAAGHDVWVMANRFDQAVVETFASRIIQTPSDRSPFIELDDWTRGYLAENLRGLMGGQGVDIALVGGWPFVGSISTLKQVAKKVVVLDYGAVPFEGMDEGGVTIQRRLRLARERNYPLADAAIAGSGFLLDSQTRRVTRGEVPIDVILAGVDHLDTPIWPAAHAGGANAEQHALALVHELKGRGRKILLNLGRWEPGTYKNSAASFDVLRGVRATHPEAALLFLADRNTEVPADLREDAFPIGFPDDQELQAIMRLTDVGLSLTLWEGHNLPLCEMQWIDRPALALDVAAHPEVVLDPWYLCADAGAMAEKASAILSGSGPTDEERARWLEGFSNYFTWDRAAADYLKSFERTLARPAGAVVAREKKVRVICDVTFASKDPANSGIIRVTRRFGRELQSMIDPLFVSWDAAAERFFLLNEWEVDLLKKNNGPIVAPQHFTPGNAPRRTLEEALGGEIAGSWLIVCEVHHDVAPRLEYARRAGLRLAVIFYDAIPVLRADLVDESIRKGHAGYMAALAEAEIVSSISENSQNDLERFWREFKIQKPRSVTNLLPGEFGGVPRTTIPPAAPTDAVKMLCVSTIEPRKNHKRLIAACNKLSSAHPTLNWQMTLVGNSYQGGADLLDFVKSACTANPKIRYAGVVDDATLWKLYEESHFTVYPSLIEGFGMPVLESMWHGRPCIAANSGVMSELAAEGGCLTVDVTKEDAIFGAMHRLAADPETYRRLGREAVERPLKTWAHYVTEWLHLLADESVPEQTDFAPPPRAIKTPDWQERLYAGCLTEHWQMHDSDRIALIGLLARIQPACTIEVGTYKAGSLSLLRQYSEMVFSIDTDWAVAKNYQHFQNVTFLTGDSATLLPILLRELHAKAVDPELILLDGDWTADAVRRDIESVLHQPLNRPLFLVVHHSFKPETRAGIGAVDWAAYPSVQWMDVDFVPGRVVEGANGAARDNMWGGLAVIYIAPQQRNGELHVNASATRMQQVLAGA